MGGESDLLAVRKPVQSLEVRGVMQLCYDLD